MTPHEGNDGPAVLRAPEIAVRLQQLRPRLKPEFRVVIDALAYLLVAQEHVIERLHDEDVTEN